MISIIIPVYNGEEEIKACLDSALGNQESDVEVILIDDGSTDNTFQICREYKVRDQRIRMYTQENQGVSSARNKGIKEAKGDWIIFLDGDDRIQIDCFLKHLAVIEDDVDMVLFKHQVVKQTELKYKIFNRTPEYFIVSQEERNTLLVETLGMEKSKLGVNLTAPWAKAYRKRFLVEHKIIFENGIRIGEDLLFNLSAYCCSKKIGVVKAVSYYYIEHSSSVMNQMRKQGLEMEYKFHTKVFEFLKSHDLWDTHYKAYFYSVLNGMLAYLTKSVMHKERRLNYKEKKEQLEALLQEQMYKEAYSVYKESLKGYFSLSRRLVIENIFGRHYFQTVVLFKVKERCGI